MYPPPTKEPVAQNYNYRQILYQDLILDKGKNLFKRWIENDKE